MSLGSTLLPPPEGNNKVKVPCREIYTGGHRLLLDQLKAKQSPVWHSVAAHHWCPNTGTEQGRTLDSQGTGRMPSKRWPQGLGAGPEQSSASTHTCSPGGAPRQTISDMGNGAVCSNVEFNTEDRGT
ncbi:hypothetical protein AAFF_G00059270 [Aldrovandia affinis]|uniref:Uncharacterized protein n=1 Tax=Aldrovandia affinis TaxID=143900 RepID=A0AAD7S006_9TELE|nr:hypothetical protein AAFF_G00059270 [Aldrovandia affinis]